MPKVYIEAGNRDYRSLFEALDFEVVSDLVKSDLVCFTGGEDVSPSLYGAFHHNQTWSNPERDRHEEGLFHTCLHNEIPMVGICRGAQFLNVMSGGAMYQHVSNHTREHVIADKATGQHVYVSSTHHQMMKPSDKAIIIAQSVGVTSHREWYDGTDFRMDISDVGEEVLFYPNTNALCFQPHPEFFAHADRYKGMAVYFNQLVEELLAGCLEETYNN